MRSWGWRRVACAACGMCRMRAGGGGAGRVKSARRCICSSCLRCADVVPIAWDIHTQTHTHTLAHTAVDTATTADTFRDTWKKIVAMTMSRANT